MKHKKVGLALGGGAVLGASHIGVLKALKELEIPIHYVAGTSIGAFVAAFYAFDKTWKEIEEIALKLKWIDISGLSISQYGLLSNEKLGELITEYLGDKKMEQASIPLAMVATDISNGKKVVLKKGSVAEAAMASTAIPGIFKPLEIEGKLLVDGGIVENVPIHTLKDMGADYIIGVDLNAKHSYKKPDNIVDVMINSFHFTLQASTKLQTKDADLLVQPDLSSFNRSDMDQVEDLIEKGYESSINKLRDIV